MKAKREIILLKSGLVVDPASGLQDIRDILIVDGKIKMIKEKISVDYISHGVEEAVTSDAPCCSVEDVGNNITVIDCSDCIVGPGLVDAHVHFRDPGFTHKEDIFSGAKAAARGGVTSVILMANTNPVVDNTDTLKYVIDKGRETDIHIYSCATITKGLKGKEVVDMSMLKECGAIGFTDDGIPLLNEKIVREAMLRAKKTSSVLSFHEENPMYIVNNGINKGVASEFFCVEGSDRQAEITMVERDVKLALETGATVNFQHISTKEAIELIRKGKAEKGGENIHGEVTPHHMLFTDEDIINLGSNGKMNPPLRTKEDRAAIIEAIIDGTLDIIATDHAPHTEDEKGRKITEAPSGIIGLETSFGTVYNTLVRTKKMDIMQAFCKMSLNPAKLYKIDAGQLAINRTANVMVFNPQKEFSYDKTMSKSFNSPLKGSKIMGDIILTICKGKIVYKSEEII